MSSLPVSVSPGQYVTATATEASTSEFSPCILVVPAPPAGRVPRGDRGRPRRRSGLRRQRRLRAGRNGDDQTLLEKRGDEGADASMRPRRTSRERDTARYSIVAGAAHYGTIPVGATADCGTHCYSLSVANLSPRPLTHWDATVIETPATDDPPRVWTLHLGDSFRDVPRSHPFYKKIEALLHGGITVGCSGSGYCPDRVVYSIRAGRLHRKRHCRRRRQHPIERNRPWKAL